MKELSKAVQRLDSYASPAQAFAEMTSDLLKDIQSSDELSCYFLMVIRTILKEEALPKIAEFRKSDLSLFEKAAELIEKGQHNTGYIEYVATSEAARGKGVCTALFQHVMQELPYNEYILDVADTKENAYRLYKKLGFTEFMRKQEKHPKLKGLNERIYMKWCKNEIGDGSVS